MQTPNFIVISTGYESRLAHILEKYPPCIFKKPCPDIMNKIFNTDQYRLKDGCDEDDQLEDYLNDLESKCINTSKLFYFQGKSTHWDVINKDNSGTFVYENFDPDLTFELKSLISYLSNAKVESFAIFSGDYCDVISRRENGMFGYCATFNMIKMNVINFEYGTVIFMKFDAESG